MIQAIIDARCNDLQGLAPKWITPGLAPMQHSGAVKAADCRTLLWSAGDYIFYNLFGGKQAAFDAWIDILRIVEKSTADFDNPDAYAEMAQLKMDVAEALTKFERDWPEQCHCIVAHEVMHVPDCIYRWNSVRNYWAFHLERYPNSAFVSIRFQHPNSASVSIRFQHPVSAFASRRSVGMITNFIHNRKDPDGNMVRGYLCSTVGRSVKPDLLEKIKARIAARPGKQPKTGFLTPSSDVLYQAGETRAGSGSISYKLHSRNRRRPYYATRKMRKLRKVVKAYVEQAQVADFQRPQRVLEISGGVSFNGKPWAQGTGCFFFLDDDARVAQSDARVGKVQRFWILEMDGDEELFIEILEHTVTRWHRDVAVVDFSKRTRMRITHYSHVVAMAAYADYWQPEWVQYKCVTKVTSTF
jgi:hypothetical protein